MHDVARCRVAGAKSCAAALVDGDSAGALAIFARARIVDAAIVHDNACVRAVASLSHVYRTLGVEGLEASIRHAGERTLLNFMPHDLERRRTNASNSGRG